MTTTTTDRLGTMSAATFASGAHLPFQVVAPGHRPLPLRLVDVSDTSYDRNVQFTLLFVGPAERPMPQGMRRMHHDALGDFPLFLVPVGQDGATVMYQAVFNRMLDRR